MQEIPMNIRECKGIMRTVMSAKDFKQDGQEMCINMYDIRYTDTQPACGLNWPPEMHSIVRFLDVRLSTFFNGKQVQRSLKNL